MDTRTVNILSICTGYGGIELGLHAALGGSTRTVCYVENEIGVASILAARMEDGSLDPAPIWTDLNSFDPEPWRGRVDILAGGFPCQPHSVAGSQLGEDDPRELSGEVLRIADGLGLPDLFLENVPGILRFYWDSIRPKLREMGYSVAESLFTASETGAPHRRERLFILAHARLGGLCQSWDDGDERRTIRANLTHVWNTMGSTTQRGGNELAHADGEGLQGRDERGDSARERAARTSSPELGELPLYPPGPNDHEGWEWLLARWPGLAPTYCKDGHDVQPEMSTTQSELLRASHGAPTGVDRRLRAVGNGVVPAMAAVAYRELASGLAISLGRRG